jgi:predicted ester cyclase
MASRGKEDSVEQERGNAEIIRQLWEVVFNRGDVTAVDELVSEDFTNFERRERGPEVWRRIALMWRTAFPDLHITVDEEIVHEDVVVHRVTARATHLGELRHSGLGVLAPTGRPVEWEHIHIFHLAGGQIISHWGMRNDVRMLQQIGVITAPEKAWSDHLPQASGIHDPTGHRQ